EVDLGEAPCGALDLELPTVLRGRLVDQPGESVLVAARHLPADTGGADHASRLRRHGVGSFTRDDGRSSRRVVGLELVRALLGESRPGDERRYERHGEARRPPHYRP